MRMRHIVLSGLPGSIVFFSTLSHKRHDFRRQFFEHEMCVLTSSTIFFFRNMSHSKKNWEVYDKMYVCFHVKYPLLLLDINGTWTFWTYFGKIFRYQISWEPLQWELSCSMQTDRRTDIAKLIFAFRNLQTHLKMNGCVFKGLCLKQARIWKIAKLKTF